MPSAAALLLIALKGSLVLIVFALGASATLHQAVFLLRRPTQLVRVVLAMNVVVPVLVVLALRPFDVAPALRIALIALALSPVPPVLPNKALRAGGDPDYTIGLLVSTCLLSIPFVPASLGIADLLLDRSLPGAPARIAVQVFASVLVPLAAGLALRHFAPAVAPRIARYVSTAATVVLVASLLPVLAATGGRILSLVGRGLLIAFATFTIVGLLVGHWLGGPRLEQRTVLALATASRHPGIALAIAQGAAPEETLVGPAVLAYLIIAAIVCLPYLRWVKYRRGKLERAPSSRALEAR